MRASAIEEGALRALVLGELSEAEAEALEDIVFSDEASMDALVCAEDDALDAWARGELAAAARASFEARLACSSAGRERLATARALATRARSERAAASPSEATGPSPSGARVVRLRIGGAVVAATAIAAAVLLGVRAGRDPSAGPQETILVALGPQVVRGDEGAVPSVRVPPGARARVRFEIPVAGTPRGGLALVVEGRGGDAARAAVTADGNGRAHAEVEAAALLPGRYRVVLREASPDGGERDIAAYDVRVDAP
jgi:hypothetical protein